MSSLTLLKTGYSTKNFEMGSNFEMGRGVQNKIYMFVFGARACLFFNFRASVSSILKLVV